MSASAKQGGHKTLVTAYSHGAPRVPLMSQTHE